MSYICPWNISCACDRTTVFSWLDAIQEIVLRSCCSRVQIFFPQKIFSCFSPILWLCLVCSFLFVFVASIFKLLFPALQTFIRYPQFRGAIFIRWYNHMRLHNYTNSLHNFSYVVGREIWFTLPHFLHRTYFFISIYISWFVYSLLIIISSSCVTVLGQIWHSLLSLFTMENTTHI